MWSVLELCFCLAWPRRACSCLANGSVRKNNEIHVACSSIKIDVATRACPSVYILRQYWSWVRAWITQLLHALVLNTLRYAASRKDVSCHSCLEVISPQIALMYPTLLRVSQGEKHCFDCLDSSMAAFDDLLLARRSIQCTSTRSRGSAHSSASQSARRALLQISRSGCRT